jgi:hypothetical protein
LQRIKPIKKYIEDLQPLQNQIKQQKTCQFHKKWQCGSFLVGSFPAKCLPTGK